MKKYKKTYAFRLEAKEEVWLDNNVKVSKLSPSTILRNLIRKEISLETAFTSKQPLPQQTAVSTQNRFGGKTIADWEKELITKKESDAVVSRLTEE
jgi:hypothetical protein